MRTSELKSAITRFNNVRKIAERMVRAAIPRIRDVDGMVIEDVCTTRLDEGEYVSIHYKYSAGLNLWEASVLWLPIELFGCSDRAIEKYMGKVRENSQC